MRYYILCFHFIVCSNIQVIIDLVSKRNTICTLCASVLRASLKLRPANSFSVRTLNHILLAFSIKYLELFLLVSLLHPHIGDPGVRRRLPPDDPCLFLTFAFNLLKDA